MLILQPATLPPFVSDNRMSGTAEEHKAVVSSRVGQIHHPRQLGPARALAQCPTDWQLSEYHRKRLAVVDHALVPVRGRIDLPAEQVVQDPAPDGAGGFSH